MTKFVLLSEFEAIFERNAGTARSLYCTFNFQENKPLYHDFLNITFLHIPK